MTRAAALEALLRADGHRMDALRAVRALDLPDGWIGAGFVRDAVWDHLHGMMARAPQGDVDVLWHDRAAGHARDDRIEGVLRGAMPALDWSVRNQARMHARNGDAPYADVANAMRHWPETATAVAVRLTGADGIAINAPLGLNDLFAPSLRPGPHFMGVRRAIFDERVAAKRWRERYPLLEAGA